MVSAVYDFLIAIATVMFSPWVFDLLYFSSESLLYFSSES